MKPRVKGEALLALGVAWFCGGRTPSPAAGSQRCIFDIAMHVMSGPAQFFLGRPNEATWGLQARWLQRRGGKGGEGREKRWFVSGSRPPD